MGSEPAFTDAALLQSSSSSSLKKEEKVDISMMQVAMDRLSKKIKVKCTRLLLKKLDSKTVYPYFTHSSLGGSARPKKLRGVLGTNASDMYLILTPKDVAGASITVWSERQEWPLSPSDTALISQYDAGSARAPILDKCLESAALRAIALKWHAWFLSRNSEETVIPADIEDQTLWLWNSISMEQKKLRETFIKT